MKASCTNSRDDQQERDREEREALEARHHRRAKRASSRKHLAQPTPRRSPEARERNKPRSSPSERASPCCLYSHKLTDVDATLGDTASTSTTTCSATSSATCRAPATSCAPPVRTAAQGCPQGSACAGDPQSCSDCGLARRAPLPAAASRHATHRQEAGGKRAPSTAFAAVSGRAHALRAHREVFLHGGPCQRGWDHTVKVWRDDELVRTRRPGESRRLYGHYGML